LNTKWFRVFADQISLNIRWLSVFADNMLPNTRLRLFAEKIFLEHKMVDCLLYCFTRLPERKRVEDVWRTLVPELRKVENTNSLNTRWLRTTCTLKARAEGVCSTAADT
jgi:hypothetical protein